MAEKTCAGALGFDERLTYQALGTPLGCVCSGEQARLPSGAIGSERGAAGAQLPCSNFMVRETEQEAGAWREEAPNLAAQGDIRRWGSEAELLSLRGSSLYPPQGLSRALHAQNGGCELDPGQNTCTFTNAVSSACSTFLPAPCSTGTFTRLPSLTTAAKVA